MARRLDQIIVIDVEATCWPPGEQPLGQESEIIEIGVAALDIAQLELVGAEDLLVKPVRSRVSPFCTQLTTLTAELVADGLDFETACQTLVRRFKVHERAWASFGDYDRNQFQRQCSATGVKYPFGATHLNVKSLLALAKPLPREVGMAEALRVLGLDLIGTHHRGGDDARNIARILATLLTGLRAP